MWFHHQIFPIVPHKQPPASPCQTRPRKYSLPPTRSHHTFRHSAATLFDPTHHFTASPASPSQAWLTLCVLTTPAYPALFAHPFHPLHSSALTSLIHLSLHLFFKRLRCPALTLDTHPSHALEAKANSSSSCLCLPPASAPCSPVTSLV